MLIRALSPFPRIEIKGGKAQDVFLMLENINPKFYAKAVSSNEVVFTQTLANTLEIRAQAKEGQLISIEPREEIVSMLWPSG